MKCRNKEYTSVIKKKRELDNKVVLLAKAKWNTIEVFMSKALIESYINHEKWVLVNNVLRKYSKMKKRNQNSWKYCGIY